MQAIATFQAGRILVRTETDGTYDFELAVEACRNVGAGRFLREDKVWSFPFSLEKCKDLRREFGSDLSILPPLAAAYTAEAALANAQAATSTASDAQLAPVLVASAPALAATLRPDQRVGVQWLTQLFHNAGLVADQPGLGKTLIVIAGVIQQDLKGPILVTCPRLAVKSVWFNLLRKWASEETVYMCRGTRAQRQKAINSFKEDTSSRRWLITVAETLRIKNDFPCLEISTGKKVSPIKCNDTKTHLKYHLKEEDSKKEFAGYEFPALFSDPWALVVVDESHRMFGSMTVTKGNLAGKGLKKLGKLADRRLAVTGTPFGRGGRVQGMFGTLHWLWPEEYTSFWRWVDKFFFVENEEIFLRGGRGRTRTVKKVGKLKGGKTEEQFLHLLGPRILRRTKAEVMPWLPPKRYEEVICEMEGEQLRQYRSLSMDAEVKVPGGIITADGILAEITRAKQIANGALYKDEEGKVHSAHDSSCKIETLLEILEARGILTGDSTTKIIIASQYNEFLFAIRQRLEELKVGFLLLTGQNSDKQRDQMMEEFQQEGGNLIFLINSKAGGVSVTLDKADEVHCLDRLWDPSDQDQLEDRADRATRALTIEDTGKRKAVTVYYYLSEGTIDTNIKEDVEAKRFEQYRAIDSVRDVEYIREMIRYRKGE